MFTLIDQPDTETRTAQTQAPDTRTPEAKIFVHTPPVRLARPYWVWWVLLGTALSLSLLDQALFLKEIVTCAVILGATLLTRGQKKSL